VNDITMLLARWRASPEAEEQLVSQIQRELRRLAGSYLRRERPGHTLQPTALVNEAYVRLVGQRRVQWESRAHFYGIAAQMMRRILVDHARKRRAQKREGFAGEPVSVSGLVDPAAVGDIDVLALHDALERLAAIEPRQARIVELRYFGGLTVDEVSAALAISSATVKRELSAAKEWLRSRMVGSLAPTHCLERRGGAIQSTDAHSIEP
jgi:RNA polymerase sigma-70 factor (ECF subfamily)